MFLNANIQDNYLYNTIINKLYAYMYSVYNFIFYKVSLEKNRIIKKWFLPLGK